MDEGGYEVCPDMTPSQLERAKNMDDGAACNQLMTVFIALNRIDPYMDDGVMAETEPADDACTLTTSESGHFEAALLNLKGTMDEGGYEVCPDMTPSQLERAKNMDDGAACNQLMTVL
ncbi:unnamed protein product [Haemonchus placei]|uniref:Secreted protein n=1 Tax=Haemonchus placei TaxID=6290 RepID=A0A0N4XB89_HAEPC|nr:unnamed protein product [Haemonchus placei]